MSIPCGFTPSGLPIGLQLIGRPFEEALLFQVAHGYEAISPSRGRRPALVDAD
jgi:aspartyl-tRNA(Asn)/glutamyl-tRNA(Gln) amidotransferase subunit A